MTTTDPNHPQILALGYSEAAMFLRATEVKHVVAILSIHGTNEFGVESTIEPRLDLHFDDAESPDPADTLASYHARMRQQAQAADGRILHPPKPEDAETIINFARLVEHLHGILLCHCNGGVSRAPAAALLCLATWTDPGQEDACVAEILRVRACASPHPDLVRFGDTLRARQGCLVRALRARIFPGESS